MGRRWVSGVAGPGGGTPEKPVGLVFLGVAHGDTAHSLQQQYIGQRADVRTRAVQAALDLVRESALDVNPVVAITLGVLFLDESLTTRVLVGAAIVLASVAVVVRTETEAAVEPFAE